jgi:hypothetical protein
MLLGLLNDQEIFFAYMANYTTFPTESSSPNLAIFLAVLQGIGLEERKGGGFFSPTYQLVMPAGG